MARLIVKSPYIKGGGAGGYAKYIATRDGVELLPSGYMEYMAERPRSHGLFGDEDDVDLNTAMKELNEYPSSGRTLRGWAMITLPNGKIYSAHTVMKSQRQCIYRLVTSVGTQPFMMKATIPMST